MQIRKSRYRKDCSLWFAAMLASVSASVSVGRQVGGARAPFYLCSAQDLEHGRMWWAVPEERAGMANEELGRGQGWFVTLLGVLLTRESNPVAWSTFFPPSTANKTPSKKADLTFIPHSARITGNQAQAQGLFSESCVPKFSGVSPLYLAGRGWRRQRGLHLSPAECVCKSQQMP